MLALGLMIAAIGVIGATGDGSVSSRLSAPSPYLDYVSVVIGLGVGLVIAVLGQISWSELPHRAAQWIMVHGRRLRLVAWGALFAAVLLYF